MRALVAALVLAVLAAGCGSSRSSVVSSPTPGRATPNPTSTSRPQPTAVTAASTKQYETFFHFLCTALMRGLAAPIRGALPFYQYNSGLRYGTLDDGEGQTGDPGLLDTWIAGSHVRCTNVTPDQSGHGTLLAGPWHGPPGAWSLIEMDTYSGVWKINDFTFGTRGALYAAMQTSHPIVAYRG